MKIIKELVVKFYWQYQVVSNLQKIKYFSYFDLSADNPGFVVQKKFKVNQAIFTYTTSAVSRFPMILYITFT